MLWLLTFVVVQLLSRVWLCDPMDCSIQGFPVLHFLPEFPQTHIHWVSDAIQPSHPLSPTSPSALSLSHIRVFSKESALGIRWPKFWSFSFRSVLSVNIQGWFPLGLTGVILLSRELSRVFSSTTVQQHQFFGTLPLYVPTLTTVHDYHILTIPTIRLH